MSSASMAVGFGSGTSIDTSSPERTELERLAGAPETRTAPSSMSFWILDRDRSEQTEARYRSSLVPADGWPTLNRRIMESRLPPLSFRGSEARRNLLPGASMLDPSLRSG